MAGFQNEYAALPGHMTQFKDQNRALRNDPAPIATDSILLLGTATDGPIMQPMYVTPQTAAAFGKMVNANGVANGATLLAKFEEAWNAGSRDIRLMRITGKNAALSLLGTSFNQTTELVQEDQLGTAQGNAAVVFTLPHGGIVTSSVVVKADGATLPTSAYTITGGTMAEPDATPTPIAEVKGTLSLNENVTDMKADITISYSYNYLDEDGDQTSGTVVDGSSDSTGNAMIADGEDTVFDLTETPKAGLVLYADGTEVTDTTVYEIDEDAKTLTLKNTVKVTRGQLLEANYAYDEVTVITPKIDLLSTFGGNVYNDLKAKVEINTGVVTITITKPESKKSIMSEPAMVFKSTDYPSFQLMCNAINTHPYNNNVVTASSKHLDTNVSSLQVKPETFFSGGDDELFLSKEEMYKRLGGTRDSDGYITKQGAYQLLENYVVDTVIPLGVYADDALVGMYDDFAYQLALACAVMSHYNQVTHGLIATSSPAGTLLEDVEAHVQKLEARANLFYMRDRFGEEIKDGDGERLDIGQFISVLAGPDIIVGNTRLGALATNPAAAYGGFVSRLPIRSAPTNKIIPNALGLRFQYSAAQLNRLTKARYTTLKLKNNNTAVAVVDAMTAAHAGSDYQRQSTGRVVKAVVNAIKEVADPYIGEPNDQFNRNALASAISKRLDAMKEDKELVGYDFQIVATPQMELMGEASIELSLRAPNELRNLTTIVSLN